MKKVQVTKDGRRWITVALVRDEATATQLAELWVALPFKVNELANTRMIEATCREKLVGRP